MIVGTPLESPPDLIYMVEQEIRFVQQILQEAVSLPVYWIKFIKTIWELLKKISSSRKGTVQ
jgi:hypothetical protein